MTDPRYEPLYPPKDTPRDEQCSCSGRPPVKLMMTLGYNPIHCMKCNLEVAPETLELEDETIDAVAAWNGLYRSVYTLWLDSDAYEDWAKAQLTDIKSRINALGLDAAKAVSAKTPCYYWLFWDEEAPHEAPASCPGCHGKWEPSGFRKNELICARCKLVRAKSESAARRINAKA